MMCPGDNYNECQKNVNATLILLEYLEYIVNCENVV